MNIFVHSKLMLHTFQIGCTIYNLCYYFCFSIVLLKCVEYYDICLIHYVRVGWILLQIEVLDKIGHTITYISLFCFSLPELLDLFANKED